MESAGPVAVFGGRLPHTPAFIPGGITTRPTSAAITKFKSYMNQIIPFIQNTYIPDAQALASVYSDYKGIGRGYGNLLAFGCFDLNSSGSSKLLRRGLVANGSTTVNSVNVGAITEQVTYSWYNNSSNNLNPASGITSPVAPSTKTAAYSWIKSPRYSGAAYEAGPLARMWVNGSYTRGISVIDRHRARAQEALLIAQAMQQWVAGLSASGAVYTSYSAPSSGAGVGLTEAARGALGHWVSISGSAISRYQIVTPTCWNTSPRDNNGALGALEQALVGTPVANGDEPVEVLRVVHSFDPCLACAVHVVRPGKGAAVLRLPTAR